MVSKYRNRKVTRNGETYDSAKEAQRHSVLKLLERAGKISQLQRQVKFELLPVQRDDRTGKVIERACSYIADFTYYEGKTFVVEDVKSPATRTKDYVIKRKLMLYIHGICIHEV